MARITALPHPPLVLAPYPPLVLIPLIAIVLRERGVPGYVIPSAPVSGSPEIVVGPEGMRVLD